MLTKLILFIAVSTGTMDYNNGEKEVYSRVETRQFSTMETCEAYGKYRFEEEKSSRNPRAWYYNCMTLQPATKAE